MNEVQKAMLFSQIRGVEPGKGVGQGSSVNQKGDSNSPSFEEILFSKHAEKRLHSRQIDLGRSEKARLSEAMQTLEKKGAKDSLVLMGEMAFVVNVPSKTVITAMERDQMKEQVFTNIDSTILI